MQLDTAVEKNTSPVEVVKNEVHASGAENNFGEESDRLQTAAGNLRHELGDLVESNPGVDLSDEKKQMDELGNNLTSLTSATKEDMGRNKGKVVDSKNISTDRIETTDGVGIEARPLYRGLWADTIKDGDKIPVVFSDEKDAVSYLQVDTSWMDDKVVNFTKERLDEVCRTDGNSEILAKWIADNGIKIDPELFHKLIYVQAKMRSLLNVDSQDAEKERAELYFSKPIVNLSELVGKAMCSERAVVGKLLLDRLGIKSSLMEGVHIDGKDLGPGAHAILILYDSQVDGSLIFDIGRQATSKDAGVIEGGYPRLLRTDKKLDYSTFEGKTNYAVPAKSIYDGSILYYGIGNDSIMQDVNFAE